MLSNSRNVALLIAPSISVITTSFLSLVEGVAINALVVCFILSFSSSYILIYITVEYFLFSQIKGINDRLVKMMRDDFSFVSEHRETSSTNPLKRINIGIFRYAERKQKEIENLKKAEAFRREFIADISHELKTPIFAAQGYVHTLLDGAIKDKNVRNKFLKKAAKSLDGLDRLVQDLLTISKMETGEIKMEMEYFNMYDLTREVFDQFEGKAEKRDLAMTFVEATPTDVMVYADRQKIYQVMLNLISNAIKYKKEGEGLMEVGFKRFEDVVEVMVRDHGMGIPHEHLSRIFERFYRVEKSRSKDKGGTGLGLSIVKHILEVHRSQIHVESVPGQGTTFWFRLHNSQYHPKDVSVRQEV
jgi:two-component system phosphate regulon sensor histidine kinase PhoR